LRANSDETADEVMLAEPGDRTRLGVRTIEDFGIMVDNFAHRCVAANTLAAQQLAARQS